MSCRSVALARTGGILIYCRAKVRFGVVEAIHGNIRSLINRGRGYKNLPSPLLKARRMAATNTELLVLKQAPQEGLESIPFT